MRQGEEVRVMPKSVLEDVVEQSLEEVREEMGAEPGQLGAALMVAYEDPRKAKVKEDGVEVGQANIMATVVTAGRLQEDAAAQIALGLAHAMVEAGKRLEETAKQALEACRATGCRVPDGLQLLEEGDEAANIGQMQGLAHELAGGESGKAGRAH